jgi:hypothetical protein
MKYLAGCFCLLIQNVFAFYSASVDFANKTVGADTNLTVSLALTDSYISIPARFKIEIVLPSTLSLKGSIGSLPGYCSVVDVPEIIITTVYNSSNPSINQQDSDLDAQCGITGPNKLTLITPKTIEVIITFKVGLVSNPSIAYSSSNMGTIQMFGYYEGSSTASFSISYTFANNYFSPCDMTSNRFDQDNLKVGGWSTYSLTFTSSKIIPANGWLIITFTSDSSLRTAAETLAYGQVTGGQAKVLGVNINSQSITLTGLSSSLIPAGSEIFLNISQVKNPRFVGYSSGSIFSSTSSNELIEKGTFMISAIHPCAITLTGYIPVNRFVLASTQIAFYFSNDIYDSSYTSQFYFTLVFPSTYVVQSNSACINAGGLGTSPSLSCSVSNNQFTSNLVTQIDKTVAIRFTSIINPPNNQTTEFLKLYLYTSANTLICMNEQIVNFTANPNLISVKSKNRASEFVTDPGPYTLTFTTSTSIPSGAYIKLVIPSDQFQETSGIQCTEASSNTNLCSKSSSQDPDTQELILKEWCSSTDTSCNNCCKSGTSFSLNLTGLRNPMYLDPSLSSQIRIYTYNPSMSAVIDLVTNAGQFQPSLSTRSSSGQISRAGDTVQLDSSLSVSFTSLVDYVSGSTVQIVLPGSLVFPSTSVTCLSSGKAVDCSYELGVNGSIRSFKVSLCSSSCPAGTFFSLRVMGLKNPTTTANVTGNFSYVVLFSNFKIETGSLVSSIQSLQPNTVSSFVFTRTSNVVSASTTVNFSFKIASKLPAGGEIMIKFPENLLLTESSIQILKGSKVLQYSGSLTDLKIIDYCESECLAGSTVNLTIIGTKNPDSVITISGIISVSSRYSSVIDSGSADVSSVISPFTPGKIFNSDIHPVDPTVSISSTYRVVFTTEHSVTTGAIIDLTLASGLLVSSLSCSEYLSIEETLSCTKSSNIVTIRNGFSKTIKGSIMVGVLVSVITNPSSPISFTGFRITLKDSNGFVVDQSPILQVTYYPPAVSCQCSKCSGSVCYECLIPSNNPFLQEYSCIAKCDDGYFLTVTQPYTCLKCHFTCKTCSSHQADACLTCLDGLYKADGACVAFCPVGTSQSGNDCVLNTPCTAPCATCSKSPDFCLSCINGYKFSIVTGSCDLQCPIGFYWDGAVCSSCYYKCSACSSASSCNGCLSYYYEQIINNGVCVAACPPGISVLKGKKCVSCDSTCATCTDTSQNDCISCSGSRYLHQGTCLEICPSGYYRSSGNLCISSCPNKNYITLDSKDCLPCNSSCQTCSNSIDCTSCIQNLFLYNSTCFSNCPQGYLKAEAGLCTKTEDCISGKYINKDWCLSCPNECSSCSSQSNCSVCASGFYLFNNTCSLTCPSGMVKKEGKCLKASDCSGHLFIEEDMCRVCNESCGNCSSFNTCTSCKGETYLQFDQCVTSCNQGYLKYENNTCLSSCPSGTFPNESNCSECMTGCLTCKDFKTCFKCENDLLLTDNFQCVEMCPAGYKPVLGYCEVECNDVDCIKCQKVNSDFCLQCKNGTILNQGICVNYCPDGMFDNENVCNFCGDSCELCQSLETCEKCQENKINHEGSCIDECPSGFFEYDKTCQSCSENCTTCESTKICSICDENSFLLNEKCVSVCPLGYDAVDSICVFHCPDNCTKCKGEKCEGCLKGNHFDGTCIEDCPQGYFPSEKTCLSCEDSCLSCKSKDFCEQCKEEAIKYEGSCLSSCPEGTKEVNKTCEVICPNNCLSCTATECTSCEEGFGFYLNSCETCPNRTYLDSGSCVDCVPGCNKCSSKHDCSSCSEGYLHESQCVSVCPSGYSSQSNKCEKSENQKKKSKSAFMIYPLIVEFLLICIILLLGSLIRNDCYQAGASGLSLFSILLFTCKVFLLASIWSSGHVGSGLLVPLTSSLLIGTSSLGAVFILMHLEPLSFQSASLEYYKTIHCYSYLLVRLVVLMTGCQFIRIIYSGLFGLPATTESKTLGMSTRFRMPLEKLSYLNVFIVSAPLMIICIFCLALFEVSSDTWQVALFTAVITLAVEGFFMVSYLKLRSRVSY